MPSTFVRKSSSTAIPFGEYSTPASSRSRPSMFGLRPVAMSTTSASTCAGLPFFSYVTVSWRLPSFVVVSAIDLTADCIENSTPRLPIVWRRRFAMSESRTGKHSFRNSITLTLLPKLLNTEANSIPMTPAPMMHKRSGIWSMSRSSVEVITPGNVVPSIGGHFESLPVAIIMLSAVYSSSPTTTVLLSLK